MLTNVHFSSKSNEWATPPEWFARLDAEFHFTLDPCCTHQTAKCVKHYTIEDDGLSKTWAGETVFVNPPYGREIGKWVQYAYEQSQRGATCVLFIPSRTDTRWWHDYCMRGEIRFIRGRVSFIQDGKSSPAPFPTAIVIFQKSA